MTWQPPSRPRRTFPIVLGGIIATILWAAGLGMYMTWSFDTASHVVTRKAVPVPKPMLPMNAEIVNGLVGGQACRECHPGQSALHSRTGHARTMRTR